MREFLEMPDQAQLASPPQKTFTKRDLFNIIYLFMVVIPKRAKTIAFLLAALFAPALANAQSLTVLPVTIQMAPGQMATTLTVINQGDSVVAFQLRSFLWKQDNSGDQLVPVDTLLASPPLGTIAPHTSQVVRMVLRQPAQEQEATYRILLDQIPPPSAPGTVRIALRLSIPIFAEPAIRALPHLQWRVEANGQQTSLVAVNDGNRHDTIRNIVLQTSDGRTLKPQGGASPYVLAGTTHRWQFATVGAPLPPGAVLHLTAIADGGHVDQAIPATNGP
jgi:fimbrial chaperone protein